MAAAVLTGIAGGTHGATRCSLKYHANYLSPHHGPTTFVRDNSRINTHTHTHLCRHNSGGLGRVNTVLSLAARTVEAGWGFALTGSGLFTHLLVFSTRNSKGRHIVLFIDICCCNS